MQDKIFIRGLRFFAYHGVNPEEKRDGQNFVLDITLWVDLRKPGRTDDLNDTVNYSKVCKTAARVMAETSYDLIERVATRVAQQILADFAPVRQVEVLLQKPQAPIKQDFTDVAVDIVRSREDF